MKLALLALTLAAFTSAVHVYAQTLTPCITGCINTSGRKAGCSSVDVKCMCTSKKFQADMLACLKAKCTPAELAAAEKFEAEFCGTS